MYIHILLVSLLQCSYQLGKSWSQDIPTARYSAGPGDIPGDVRRRRQNSRFQESIRLKPPPPDWPSPTLGAADFLYDRPEVTPVSPLQAYQAKLQEEYRKELEEQSQKKPTQSLQNVKEEASVWSSSDEDFKKLLDPNELLKLNKKLAPILTQQNKIASYLRKGLIDTTEKSANVVPSAKAKKTRKKSTNAPVHQMKNENKIKSVNDVKTSLDQEKTRVRKLKMKKAGRTKTGEEKLKSKRQKVKAKKFAFAIHRSSEIDRKRYLKDDVSRFQHSMSVSKLSSGKRFGESAGSSGEEISVTLKNAFTKGTTTTTLELSKETPKTDDLKTTLIPYVQTSTTPKIFIESSTLTTPYTSWLTDRVKIKSTTSVRKMEVRENRKQIKQEMEKVLKDEQLEGSFGDGDSEWMTSETPKFPIMNVTPHAALLGVLKNKIVSFVDEVLKSKLKL